MPSAPRTSSRSLRLFAGAAVAAVLLAGCTTQGGSADALQKACVDTAASAIKLIDAADSCGAGFVEAVFTTEATAAAIDGEDGKDGTNGVDGADGTNGLNGATGATGLTGATGADGATVLNGTTGPRGPAGADGADGLYGPAGPQGDRGLNGADGPAGATGATGASGTIGATGAQGPAGNSLLASNFGTNVGGARDSRAGSCIVGTLSLSAASYTGEGLVADGRHLPISSNSALFSLLGTNYGGDGRTTFALPDMSDITPDNMTWMVCDHGVFPSPR